MDVSDFYNFSTLYVLSLHGIMEKDRGKRIPLARHYSIPSLKLNFVKSSNHYTIVEICLPTARIRRPEREQKSLNTFYSYFLFCEVPEMLRPVKIILLYLLHL